MRRSLLVVGLCCLLVLAGCGGTSTQPTASPSPSGTAAPDGGGGDGGAGSDDGDGGTADDGESDGSGDAGGDGTDGGSSFEYPEGVDDSGVADSTALFDAHVAAVSGTDYAINLTQVAAIGENRTHATSVVRSDLDRERSLGRFEVTGQQDTSVAVFRNTSDFYRRQTAAGRTSYRVRNATGSFATYHERRADVLRSANTVFQFANLSSAEIVERDGRRMARYTLDEVDRTAINESTTITDASAELLVDERGVIHRGYVEIDGERDGEPRRLFVEFRTTATGDVPVERPGWLGTAEEEAGT
ncbi:hypothetical protein [Haloglomus litoreum]|uniref:hypothetical protein n=1 Tax=Haloglomus litoreum TaxID=3034026 RepID=UPI0023E79AAE|nr:hypothetical protein [Haloglomus sp. DT116]